MLPLREIRSTSRRNIHRLLSEKKKLVYTPMLGSIRCSSKSSKSTPQASQQAFSTSESAPAYFFERDCFVDSFWGALGSDFGAFWDGDGPKSDPRAPQKLSTRRTSVYTVYTDLARLPIHRQEQAGGSGGATGATTIGQAGGAGGATGATIEGSR